VTVATVADIHSANSILDGQSSAGGGTVIDSVTNIAVDGFIDTVVVVSQYLARNLPGQFWDWIAQACTSYEEVLHTLTGDSAAITGHIAWLLDASFQIDAKAGLTDQARSQAITCWQGPGAEAFLATVDVTGAVTRSTAVLLRSVASDHFTLCGQLLNAKRGVFTLFQQLKSDLSGAVPMFLAQMGLAITGSVITLVGGTIGGAVNGAAGGAASGWHSGGVLGAIGGFLGGAVSGGIHGAEDAARMVPALFEQAFRNFVSWALGRVQAALNHLADFVRACIDPMVAVIGNIAGAGVRAERAASLLRGAGDPGSHADAPQPGSYGSNDQGDHPRATDGDLIALNQAIGDPTATLPPGYSRLTPAELAALGLTPDTLLGANGFIADVFRTPGGRYVVAFGGTTVGPGGAMPDVVEDGVGATTMSPQTQQVLSITDAIQRSGNGDNIIYTGHSLGGRLAAIAAIDTGNAAVTYDSAGVSQATIDYVAAKNGVDPSTLVAQANDGQIRRYYAGDDALTFAQERWPVSAAGAPDALGTPIEVGPEKNTLTTIEDGTTFVAGHMLDHMSDLWQAQYGPNGTTPAR
jgi:hypothetical protein